MTSNSTEGQEEPGADRTVFVGSVAASPNAPPSPGAPSPATQMVPGGLIGLQLNDLFEVTRFIAQGGMGEVYEGRNIASGERVAIKVILPQYASDEQFFALFKREASALERIGHDALVKYRALAYDRTSQLNYLAIEYVDGPPLSDVLDGTPADPQTIVRLLRRLAAGLGAAHEAGVIHRDLSPDNVLLPEGRLDRAKIIDFGIAKDTNPGEKSVVGDAFAGKFGYAAPEIFGKYNRAVGPWTDVYSLALVILAVARGRPLDMGITIVDALDARACVPDLSFLAPELQPVFARMLEPDPSQRFGSMDEVIAALDGAPADLRMATAVQPAPAFVRADTAPIVDAPAKSRKFPLYLAAGVVGLALVTSGAYFLTAEDKPDMAATPDATAPEPSSPASSALAWDSARPQIIEALTSVACGDLRLGATDARNGIVHIEGWHSSSVSIPNSVAGWRLERSAATSVPSPSPETCQYVRELRSVAAAHEGFAIRSYQRVAQTGDSGAPITVDLGLGQRPEGSSKLIVASVDDRPGPKEQRVVSFDPAEVQADLSSLMFEGKPKRYLIALVAGPKTITPVDWPLDLEKLRAACRGGQCAIATGWVDAVP